MIDLSAGGVLYGYCLIGSALPVSMACSGKLETLKSKSSKSLWGKLAILRGLPNFLAIQYLYRRIFSLLDYLDFDIKYLEACAYMIAFYCWWKFCWWIGFVGNWGRLGWVVVGYRLRRGVEIFLRLNGRCKRFESNVLNPIWIDVVVVRLIVVCINVNISFGRCDELVLHYFARFVGCVYDAGFNYIGFSHVYSPTKTFWEGRLEKNLNFIFSTW